MFESVRRRAYIVTIPVALWFITENRLTLGVSERCSKKSQNGGTRKNGGAKAHRFLVQYFVY